MAERAVRECGVSIRLASEMFRVSQACFRCESKTNAENEQIAHWLIRLTDNHRTWGFGLCILIGVNCCNRQHTAPSAVTPKQRIAIPA